MAWIKNKFGFTMLELIITIFIFTVGILAAYYLVNLPMSYTSTSVSRLTASYLAQEGIEIVRNIRDTNLVKGQDWRSGMADNNCEADYLSTSLSCPASNQPLRLSSQPGSQYYNYISGTIAPFTRIITIGSNVDGSMSVSVTVSWIGKQNGSVTVQENLYNWYLP